MKYVINFTHTVEETYEAIVEASSKEEAKELFNEYTFNFVAEEIPIEVRGLDIDINSITKEDE
jgi:hypothetical protein